MSEIKVEFQSINNYSKISLGYLQGTITGFNKGFEKFYIIDRSESDIPKLEITNIEFLKLIKTKFDELESFNDYITKTFYEKGSTVNLTSYLKPLVTWMVDNYEMSDFYTIDDVIENPIMKKYIETLLN